MKRRCTSGSVSGTTVTGVAARIGATTPPEATWQTTGPDGVGAGGLRKRSCSNTHPWAADWILAVMKRIWRSLGSWTTILVGGGLGVGGALLASIWLPGQWATSIGGGLAAISALVTARTKHRIEERWELRRRIPESIAVRGRSGGLPRVRDIHDPVLLGVHRAESGGSGGIPPYVPREIDQELRNSLGLGGLIVIMGESTAGKSRAALEALRVEVPECRLAAPTGREALATVVADLSESPRAVLWLDDLERFMGPGGMTPATVARLSRHILLATMRRAEYDRYTARATPLADEQDRSTWRAGQDVLRNAHLIMLDRLWSTTELDAAAQFTDDPRIARALRLATTFGIAETLTAGPELARDWHQAWSPGAHPRAAALVRAAVDCRRAGLDDPVPRRLLELLHDHYLSARGGHSLRPEPIEAAWQWAQQPVHGASSLLIPAGPSDQDPCYLAFDYLIDLPDQEPVPPETWNTLLAEAEPAQASRIAGEAFWHVREAFRRAIASGIIDDIHFRATVCADLDDYASAIRILEEAFEEGSPNRSLRHQIAFFRLLDGQIDEADAAFRELLVEAETDLASDDEYIQVVKHNIASCAQRRGDLQSALAQFEQILSDRTRYLGPLAMNTLATRACIAGIIADMGDAPEALRRIREIVADDERALGPDHTNTLTHRSNLVNLLNRTGDTAAAIRELQGLIPALARAYGADSPELARARQKLAEISGHQGA